MKRGAAPRGDRQFHLRRYRPPQRGQRTWTTARGEQQMNRENTRLRLPLWAQLISLFARHRICGITPSW